MKKLRIMIIIIILFFSFFLMMYFKKRDYKITYKLNKYSITEKYNKKDNVYYVDIKYKNDNYFYIIKDNYNRKRKLVTNIKYYKNKSETEKCLTIKFNKKSQEPSCIKNKEYVSKYLISDSLKNKIGKSYFKEYQINNKNKSYKSIDIYNLNSKKIFIWNYHGFYYLSNNKNKEIKLFENDVYDPNLIGQINNYLVMPDYNNLYEYTSLKVLNTDNIKTKTLKLNENISDESYVLGYNDESLFIFDAKYQKEYEIVPSKLKYRTVDAFIYNKGKKEERTKLSLTNKKEKFIYDKTYDYKLIGNKLYKVNKYNDYKILITNKDVKDIVKSNEEEVYFISDDNLYVYSDRYNLKLILNYFELNFNYKNIIYIF